jgi:hypothetical protein
MEGEQDNCAGPGGPGERRAAARRRAARAANPDGGGALMKLLSRFAAGQRMRLRATGPTHGRHRIPALILLGLAGCAYAVVSGGQVNRAKAEQIYAGLQQFRGLSFKTEVPLVVMSAEQADQVLRRQVTSRKSGAGLKRAAKVGAMTALYAPGMDLAGQTMRMLDSQVAGFYYPADREMILVEGKSPHSVLSALAGFFTGSDPTNEMLLAHELTHALQDQYFDIHHVLDRIRNDDDRKLALKSIAEGDATLAAYGYVEGGLSAGRIDELVTHLGEMPRLFDAESPDTPAALRESLIFQYADGTRFVGEAYKRGGWAAVNALYTRPPLSTRQIIDPALYFDHPAPPVAITVAGWQRALKGWHPVAQNSYGELLLRVILKRNPSDEPQVVLARGWRGDRMLVLEKDGALTVIWLVALRDGETAETFARIYRGILDRLPPSAGATPHRVDRRGDAVLAVIGEGAAQFSELGPALWRASVIDEAAPPTAPAARG